MGIHWIIFLSAETFITKLNVVYKIITNVFPLIMKSQSGIDAAPIIIASTKHPICQNRITRMRKGIKNKSEHLRIIFYYLLLRTKILFL